MLTREQEEQLRQMLLAQYEEIKGRLDQNERFGLADNLAPDSTGELSRYDNHPADMGTEQFEREKDLALANQARRQLREIEEALQALDEGRYGICQTCGASIPFERLEALPTALYCKDHAADQFVSRTRPLEEESLSPPFGRFNMDNRDATFYDAEDAWQDVASHGTSETPSDLGGREPYQ